MISTLFFKESLPMFFVISFISLVLIYIFSSARIYIFTCYIILICFLVYFYRIPKRNFLPNNELLIAPSDGTVKQIIYDPKKKTYTIVAFLHIFNQHLQFYPVDGVIKETNYQKGKFHPAYMLEKSKYNERMTTVLNTKYGDIKITQIAGQIARRIVNHAKPSMKVSQGDYMGMIKLSSRVDIEFSAEYLKPTVKVGDLLYAKETIIAVNSS